MEETIMQAEKTYFVVGGSSVSGQAILAGLAGPGVRLISTTSGTTDVKGADGTIHGIDLSDADAADKMIAGLNDELGADGASALAALIYVPARGEVGMPAAAATREMIEASLDYSVRPMLKMMQALRPQLTVCISGFITMDPMLSIYGAMTYTKLIMEDLAVRHPDRFKVLRLGMFPSKSVRGIALLVQKNAMRKAYPELEDLLYRWRDSGVKKFPDWMWQRNWEFEERVYRDAASFDKPFRPTTADDIRLAIGRLVRDEKKPILNVLGDWVWSEDRMPAIPEIIRKNENLLENDLDQYFEN